MLHLLEARSIVSNYLFNHLKQLWLLRIEIKSIVLYCKFIRPGCSKENNLAFQEVVAIACYNDSKENCY